MPGGRGPPGHTAGPASLGPAQVGGTLHLLGPEHKRPTVSSRAPERPFRVAPLVSRVDRVAGLDAYRFSDSVDLGDIVGAAERLRLRSDEDWH